MVNIRQIFNGQIASGSSKDMAPLPQPLGDLCHWLKIFRLTLSTNNEKISNSALIITF
jgi:hypothetical protein